MRRLGTLDGHDGEAWAHAVQWRSWRVLPLGQRQRLQAPASCYRVCSRCELAPHAEACHGAATHGGHAWRLTNGAVNR